MPAKAESRLWKNLRDATKDKVRWTRMESWALPGVPDLYGIAEGYSFWVELKVHRLKLLKAIKLSPHQINWQIQHIRHGGVVWNLVSHPPSRTLHLITGKRALELGQMTENKGPIVPDYSWKVPFPWEKIIDQMLSAQS